MRQVLAALGSRSCLRFSSTPQQRSAAWVVAWVLCLSHCASAWSPQAVAQFSAPTNAQGNAQPGSAPVDDEAQIAALANPALPAANTEGVEDRPTGIDLITLAQRGGVLMWPIGLMSLLVVTLAVERFVSFRKGRMVPGRLVRRLNQLIKEGGGQLDAEAALVACRENRSAAATVISAMLMRTGRPLGEIEHAGQETAQRQADDHAGPIRWLNLAAAATPLMGLLGTVWGMIVAFHESSNLTSDRSRSEQLSEGIYTALVTTLAGLAVAIPAAILAQYLENRLTKLFHKIETLAFTVAPALAHYDRAGNASAERLPPVSAAIPPVIARGAEVDGRSRTGSDAKVGKR